MKNNKNIPNNAAKLKLRNRTTNGMVAAATATAEEVPKIERQNSSPQLTTPSSSSTTTDSNNLPQTNSTHTVVKKSPEEKELGYRMAYNDLMKKLASMEADKERFQQLYERMVQEKTKNANNAALLRRPKPQPPQMIAVLPHLITFGQRDFLLCRLLGEGSFGRVFLGVSNFSLFAIKIAPLGNEKEFAEEVDKEISFLHQVRGSRIVCLEYANSDPRHGMIGIVFEYCHMSLDHLIQEAHGRALVGRRMNILIDIAEGLVACHHSNPPLIHRDLKPDNVLLKNESMDGLELRAKLGDFGLSRGYKKFGQISLMSSCGTPGYKAPEMEMAKDGHIYSPKVDIFSFGILMWEVVKHKRVPDIDLPHDILKPRKKSKVPIHVQQERHRLQRLTAQLPEEWRSLFMRCTAENENERPAAVELFLTLKNMKKTVYAGKPF